MFQSCYGKPQKEKEKFFGSAITTLSVKVLTRNMVDRDKFPIYETN